MVAAELPVVDPLTMTADIADGYVRWPSSLSGEMHLRVGGSNGNETFSDFSRLSLPIPFLLSGRR